MLSSFVASTSRSVQLYSGRAPSVYPVEQSYHLELCTRNAFVRRHWKDIEREQEYPRLRFIDNLLGVLPASFLVRSSLLLLS